MLEQGFQKDVMDFIKETYKEKYWGFKVIVSNKKEIIKIYSAKLFTHYLHQLFHIKIISDSISQSIITTLF